MEIHNLMEDLVVDAVQQLCRQDEVSPEPRYCTDPECITDAVCYALNRISPRYVSSGRGMAHFNEELLTDQQVQVDVLRLAAEGLKRVTSVRRTYYGARRSSDRSPAGTPAFNFPAIKGRIFNGLTFEPLCEIEVALYREEALMGMMDARWQNPYPISKQTAGTFVFWPESVSAETVREERTFAMEVRVDSSGFEPLRHIFEITVTSEAEPNARVTLNREHCLPDLYMFAQD